MKVKESQYSFCIDFFYILAIYKDHFLLYLLQFECYRKITRPSKQSKMSYTIFQPCQDLKTFISHFWVADWGVQTQDNNSTYFVTANSLTEIAFGFADNELLFSSVQGQTNRHRQISAGGFYQMFGVSLYSYAVPFLFHLPASEVNNLFLSTETLMGNEAKLLTEKIALASTTNERINILTDYIKSQLKKQRFGDNLIISAVQHIKKHNGNLNIADLSSNFCLSQKQFERRFKANAGFNPKLYTRIVRFETALNNREKYTNLTEVAHANGYYDQAHFISDFRAFSGYSPNKFFALSGY